MREPLVSGCSSAKAGTNDRSYPPIERKPATFDPATLQGLLDGDYAEIRNQIKWRITQLDFRYHEGTSVVDYRRQVLDWAKKVAEMGIGRIFMPKAIGGEADPRGLKSKAISYQVDNLCAEVRQEAVRLVDAFGIPDSCIAAPIAL
ncbi:MAG TPA: acyl-CoA dehydrogenase [Chthoniobacterales bacterium]|jgi:hypothetical protein|nr:acyl-CoA dehydrogenase [Chthoniobacterales bacterium]